MRKRLVLSRTVRLTRKNFRSIFLVAKHGFYFMRALSCHFDIFHRTIGGYLYLYINKLVAVVDSIEMASMRKKTDNDIMRENFCSILWLNRNTEMKRNETKRNKTRHVTKNKKSMEETCECWMLRFLFWKMSSNILL